MFRMFPLLRRNKTAAAGKTDNWKNNRKMFCVLVLAKRQRRLNDRQKEEQKKWKKKVWHTRRLAVKGKLNMSTQWQCECVRDVRGRKNLTSQRDIKGSETFSSSCSSPSANPQKFVDRSEQKGRLPWRCSKKKYETEEDGGKRVCVGRRRSWAHVNPLFQYFMPSFELGDGIISAWLE